MKKAQTALEYIILIGAVVVLVAGITFFVKTNVIK
ncbi:class III signal peptide-containing protein [Candidatus Micrarchaeota archaeon]|nr:class III signal peptide-containing protein [Candidatus Micrarchaeota archaeon]